MNHGIHLDILFSKPKEPGLHFQVDLKKFLKKGPFDGGNHGK